MNATAPATSAEIAAYTDADRAEAARWVRPVRTKFWADRGTYQVTVGGYVIGTVQRHAVATSKTATWWSVEGDTGTFQTRREAMDHLGRTDAGVQAYRAAAREGAFGTAAQRVEEQRSEALLAALDAEYDAEQATDADPERDDDGNVTGDLVDEPEAAAELAATQPAGGCFYCQGELSGRTRMIDYGGHRLAVHEVCVPDTEVFTEGDAPDSTPGKVVDHHGDTTMRQPAAGTVLVRWSRNTVVWTEVAVLRTRAALDTGPASPSPRGVGWHGCRASGRGLARRAARRSRR